METIQNWWPVKGYEGRYLINLKGEIKTVKKDRYHNSKLLKLHIKNSGYYFVTLTDKNGGRQKFYLHRLIASHFIPNPNNLPIINHKDGNKLNNNIENIEWCSYSENIKHGYRTLGRVAWNKGKIFKNKQDMKKTVNVRMYEDTWKRLKIKAVKERKTLLSVIDEVSKKV